MAAPVVPPGNVLVDGCKCIHNGNRSSEHPAYKLGSRLSTEQQRIAHHGRFDTRHPDVPRSQRARRRRPLSSHATAAPVWVQNPDEIGLRVSRMEGSPLLHSAPARGARRTTAARPSSSTAPSTRAACRRAAATCARRISAAAPTAPRASSAWWPEARGPVRTEGSVSSRSYTKKWPIPARRGPGWGCRARTHRVRFSKPAPLLRDARLWGRLVMTPATRPLQRRRARASAGPGGARALTAALASSARRAAGGLHSRRHCVEARLVVALEFRRRFRGVFGCSAGSRYGMDLAVVHPVVGVEQGGEEGPEHEEETAFPRVNFAPRPRTQDRAPANFQRRLSRVAAARAERRRGRDGLGHRHTHEQGCCSPHSLFFTPSSVPTNVAAAAVCN